MKDPTHYSEDFNRVLLLTVEEVVMLEHDSVHSLHLLFGFMQKPGALRGVLRTAGLNDIRSLRAIARPIYGKGVQVRELTDMYDDTVLEIIENSLEYVKEDEDGKRYPARPDHLFLAWCDHALIAKGHRGHDQQLLKFLLRLGITDVVALRDAAEEIRDELDKNSDNGNGRRALARV